MATKVVLSFVAFVVAAATWEGAMAQSGCTNVLISMSPCLNYINGNSATPSSQCCTQLASVVRSSPECLCQVLNGGGSSTGLNVNRTRALELPAACNVQTPPISRCNAAGSPAASPSGTPEKAVPSTPSGTGSKNVPSTEGDGTSAGSSTNLSISLLFFLLVAASYGSIFTLA